MGRTSRKQPVEALELNMTAMCDVVFQLLIYLILTAKPTVGYSNVEIVKPKTDDEQKIIDIQPVGLEVMVCRDGYVVAGKRVQIASLGKVFDQAANVSTTQTVIIKCTWDSPHEKLMHCLDQCSRAKLVNLSVLSM